MGSTWINIKKDLSQQFYCVNDTWLRDCVDYYKSEHPDATHAEILAFVISQWQLSDLREINNENGCLPKNLNQQKLITLPTTYILQIEKGYDISTSKYKQLEKIRNVSNENAEVNESDKNSSWEPKGKRMMNLYVTDGMQDITAIEYQPIKFLKDLILPGLKIMIKGPIICRRGVLLLNEKNCCEIGGEVEGLLIKNATENVLARALNLVENPDPYKDSAEVDQNKQDEMKFNDFMDIDLEELDKIENLHANNKKNTSMHSQSMNMMTSVTRRDSVMLNSLPVCFESVPEKKNEMDDTDDEFIQMIDEDNLNVIEQKDDQLNNRNLIKKEEEKLKINDFNFDSNDFPNELEMEDLEIAAAMEQDYSNYSNNMNDNGFSNKHERKINDKHKTNSTYKTSNDNMSKEKYTSVTAVNKTIEKLVIARPVLSHNDKKAPTTTSAISSLNKRSPSVSSSPLKVTPKLSRKPSDSKFDPKNNQKITLFMKKPGTPENSNETSSSPMKNYESIKELLAIMPVNKVTRKTVKGTVKSMQRLKKKDQNWYLEGSVFDDSASIEIFFSSEILEKIVGLTVAEFSKRKKLKKTNPTVEHELRAALRRSESTISKLNGLLELELIPNEAKAKLVTVR